ncbi:hypothetical protein STANM309S_00793 [Streptomyces tanashiensis]
MPASAARTPPARVQIQRSDHQPEDQPSSGAAASTAVVRPASASASAWSAVVAPGTSGAASEPSVA